MYTNATIYEFKANTELLRLKYTKLNFGLFLVSIIALVTICQDQSRLKYSTHVNTFEVRKHWLVR
jgi:hypothetical protein